MAEVPKRAARMKRGCFTFSCFSNVWLEPTIRHPPPPATLLPTFSLRYSRSRYMVRDQLPAN